MNSAAVSLFEASFSPARCLTPNLLQKRDWNPELVTKELEHSPLNSKRNIQSALRHKYKIERLNYESLLY